MRPSVIVITKEPRAGRVKTRLGKEIGMPIAAWWYRHQVRRLFRILRDPRWRVILSIAPDTRTHSVVWPRDFVRMKQGGGDLGDRMGRALRAAPPGPTLLIASDVPGVTKEVIVESFELLKRHEALIGPSPDGGYWAVGVRHPALLPPTLFKNVRWSGEYAREDTLKSMAPLDIGWARPLQDVDTVEDLQQTR